MKNRFYSRHPLILSLLLLCFAHFSFVQATAPTSVASEQSVELYLQDSVFVPGQLLGLNASGTWIGGVFNVSSDLSTVTDDPTFVVPPIQIPDPSTGFNDTIDYYAIDYNPVDGLYYLLADNSAGGINLYSVDIATAATVDLGLISFDNYIVGGTIRGMTFDNSGNLYLMIFEEFFNPPHETRIKVIPAGMLTNPVPVPMTLSVVSIYLETSLGSMSYNFDDNTIYFAADSTLHEFDLSGSPVNLVNYTAPDGCDGQTIEYVGNGILYGGSCDQIYQIDLATGATDTVLATYTGNFTDLLFVPPTNTSIELTEFETDFIVDIFPNPTNDELTILFETINSDDINFKLTDVLGRTIMEENIRPDIGLNTKVIDLSQLTSAVYFVVMDDGRAVRKVLRE